MFNSRRLKISVRVLMLLVLTVGVLLAWRVNRARRQREAVEAVKEFGGEVYYDFEFVTGPLKTPQATWGPNPRWGRQTPGRNPPAPNWLRRTVGDEYFQEIAYVRLLTDSGAVDSIHRSLESGGPMMSAPEDNARRRAFSDPHAISGIDAVLANRGSSVTREGRERIAASMPNLKRLKLD
jgi:hypothetical protein